MSTVVTTLQSVCAGGNHLTFRIALDGGGQWTRVLDIDHIRQPVTDEDMDTFLRLVAKLALRGRTVPQARTLLLAGVTLTI